MPIRFEFIRKGIAIIQSCQNILQSWFTISTNL